MRKDQALKLFKGYVEKYINKFGIKHYEYFIQMDGDKDNRATTHVEITDGIAVVVLSSSWLNEEDPSRKEIERVALHEVCEILLSHLGEMAKRHYNHLIVERELHKIIRVLENVFLGIS